MLRVAIIGECDTAKATRGTLARGGFVVTDTLPRITIRLDEGDVAQPMLDGVDSDLERHLLAAIADETPSGRVLIQRAGGNRSDVEMHITVPATDAERVAMETALLHGLDWFARGRKKKGWFR